MIQIDMDMPIPQNCFMCPFGIHQGTIWSSDEKYYLGRKEFRYDCFFTGKAMTSTKRNRFCPLIVKEEDLPK